MTLLPHPTPPPHPRCKDIQYAKNNEGDSKNNSFLRAPPLAKLHGRLHSRNHEDGAGCGGPPRRGPGGFYNIRAAHRSGGKSREEAGWVQKRWTGNEAAPPKGTQPGWWGSEGIEKKKDGRSSSTTRLSARHIYPDVQHTIHGGGKVQSTEAGPPIVVWTCFVRITLQSRLRQPFEGKQATRPGNPVTKNLRHNSGMALAGRSANLGAWSVWAYRILVVETSFCFEEQARTLIFKGKRKQPHKFWISGKTTNADSSWWLLGHFHHQPLPLVRFASENIGLSGLIKHHWLGNPQAK